MENNDLVPGIDGDSPGQVGPGENILIKDKKSPGSGTVKVVQLDGLTGPAGGRRLERVTPWALTAPVLQTPASLAASSACGPRGKPTIPPIKSTCIPPPVSIFVLRLEAPDLNQPFRDSSPFSSRNRVSRRWQASSSLVDLHVYPLIQSPPGPLRVEDLAIVAISSSLTSFSLPVTYC
jgi:hypothetical protein